MSRAMVLGARDAIVRLATTPGHQGCIESAAEELLARPGWRVRRPTLGRGLIEARALVAQHGSAEAAEAAIDGGAP